MTAGIVEWRVAFVGIGEAASVVDAHELGVDAVAFAALNAAGVTASIMVGCQGHVMCCWRWVLEFY